MSIASVPLWSASPSETDGLCLHITKRTTLRNKSIPVALMHRTHLLLSLLLLDHMQFIYLVLSCNADLINRRWVLVTSVYSMGDNRTAAGREREGPLDGMGRVVLRSIVNKTLSNGGYLYYETFINAPTTK